MTSLLNRLILIVKNLTRKFQITILFVIVIISLYVGVSRLFDKPDFSLFDKNIQRIDFVTYVKLNNTVEKKVIRITNPVIIKVFCDDIKCCSKNKYFENNHTRGWYYVYIHKNGKIFKMQMGFTVKGNFLMSILGNFESKGNVRKYSNPKIKEFIDLNIESKLVARYKN